VSLARLATGSLVCLSCTACAGWQSALEAHGTPATGLLHLTWLLFVVGALVWICVMAILVLALRSRAAISTQATATPDTRVERRLNRAVTGAVIATALIVMGLTITSFWVARVLSPESSSPLRIRVRGYQWWWQVTYLDARPDRTFITANEIHVPSGRPIVVELSAADVIHSFWVPNLAGKQDLIPGRDNTLQFTAREPGTYRGQCAEFCGLQHAHMAFLVIVDPPEQFEHWREAQLAPGASPGGTQEQQGQRVFQSKACAACHTVQGTSAAATVGPDLTHVGSRRYIAAGLLETTRGSLAAWIADPQTLKPGTNMPMVPLNAEELNAVSAYLVSLK